MVLDQFGIGGDVIFHFLIPGVIMYYGAKKLLSASPAGSKGWGIFVFLFGLLMLAGKLDLLFHSLLAIGVMYLGYRMLRRKSRIPECVPSIAERQWAQSVLREDAIDRWEKELRSRQN